MKPICSALLAVLVSCAAAARAEAQLLSGIPLTLEARLGAALPTGDFAQAEGGIEAEPGLAFAAGVMLNVIPLVTPYAEYREERFGCGECSGVDLDESARSAGAEVGAQVGLPLPLPLPVVGGLGPWARAGLVWQALELSGDQGAMGSEYGVGFAVGGGVRLGFGPLTLLPGVHYRSYPARFEFEDLPSRDVDVTHLVVDLGATVSF